MQPNGIHHLAVMTADLDAQLEFFTQVVGLPLVALYDMHGAVGALHAFVQLDETSSLAFVYMPGTDAIASTLGVTHAGHGGGASAPGTMQHVAFGVAEQRDLETLRDRLRSNGVVVFGPIDHGMCQSIYFAGPEGLTLEAAWSATAIDADAWIDPSVFERAGITAADIERYRTPPTFEAPSTAVAQPGIDSVRPHLAYPADEYAVMIGLPDDVVIAAVSQPDPPVSAP